MDQPRKTSTLTGRPRRPRTPRQVIVSVALRPSVIARLDAEAQARDLSRPRWIAALVCWRLHRRPQVRRDDELAIIAAQADLRRLVVRIDQVLRAWPSDADPICRESVEGWRAEVRAALDRLQTLVATDLSYWNLR